MRWRGVAGVRRYDRLTVVGVHRYAHLLGVEIHFRVDNKLIINLLLPTNYVFTHWFNNRRFLPRSLSIDTTFNDHDVQRRVVLDAKVLRGTATTTTPNEIRDDRGYTVP